METIGSTWFLDSVLQGLVLCYGFWALFWLRLRLSAVRFLHPKRGSFLIRLLSFLRVGLGFRLQYESK